MLRAAPAVHVQLEVVAGGDVDQRARTRRTAARVATLFLPLRRSAAGTRTSSAAASPRPVQRRFHVGGLFRRFSRHRRAVCFLRSSACRRPARPAARLDRPGGVPRCFVRRLRFVWAIASWSLVAEILRRARLRSSATAHGGRVREALERGPRREPDELGLGDRVAWRAIASTTARSGVARWSSTLVETCAASRCVEPQRRSPGRDSRPSGPALADQRGDRLRVLERRRRRELDVERDQRRARGDEHRAGGRVRARGGPKSGVSSPAVDPAPRAPPVRRARSSARVRPPARIAVQEHGQLELRRRAGRRARAPRRTPRRDRPRSGTRSAATSSAPTRGWMPSWRVESIRSIALASAADDRSRELAGLAGEREHAAVVVGVGVDVEQPRARTRACDRVDRLRGRAPRRRSGRRAASLGGASTYRPPSSTARPSTSRLASSTTTSRWIGTDTVPPIPALAPNATCTVPRIFSSSSTLPVSWPGRSCRRRARRGCVPALAVRSQPLEVLGPEPVFAPTTSRPSVDGQDRGLFRDPDRRKARSRRSVPLR